MRFVIDNQLPPALARYIASKGYIAEHILDIGPGDASDEAIWAYATGIGAVIISKDEDFPGKALSNPNAVPVVWLRAGNTTKQVLLDCLNRCSQKS